MKIINPNENYEWVVWLKYETEEELEFQGKKYPIEVIKSNCININ